MASIHSGRFFLALAAAMLLSPTAKSKPTAPITPSPARLPGPRFVTPASQREAPQQSRSPIAILDALRKMPVIVPPNTGAPAEAFDRWRRSQDALRRQRVNLISELEVAGYAGKEMPVLRKQKIADIRAVMRGIRTEYLAWDNALREMGDLHPSEPIGAFAELATVHDAARLIAFDQLSLSDADLRRAAALEIAALDVIEPEWTGDALLDALRLRDKKTRDSWNQWFIDNLPAASLARKAIETDMRFGKPIRLQGAGMAGEQIDTRDWLGDVILVDFWGSWCGPCVVEMPELAKLKEALGGRGFHILGVVYDSLDRARSFLASHAEYDWPNIAPVKSNAARAGDSMDGYTSTIADQFGVTSYPTRWLIDRKGQLRKVDSAGSLRETIETLLKEPASK